MEICDARVKMLREKNRNALLRTREISLDQKHVSRLAAEDNELVCFVNHERRDGLLVDLVEDLEAADTERISILVDGVQQEEFDCGIFHGEIGSEGFLDLQIVQHPLVGVVGFESAAEPRRKIPRHLHLLRGPIVRSISDGQEHIGRCVLRSHFHPVST